MKNIISLVVVILTILSQSFHAQDSLNVTQIGRWAGGPCNTVETIGSIAYFGRGGYLQIADFSDPLNPIELGKVLTSGLVYDISIDSHYAYVAAGSAGLRVVDITDPINPFEIAYLATPTPFHPMSRVETVKVKVFNNHVYLHEENYGLRIVNVSDPSNPIEISNYGYFGNRDFVVSKNYTFSTEWNGLQINDISDPKNSVEVIFYETSHGAQCIDINNDYLYLSSYDSYGITVIDITDPQNPKEIGSYPIDEKCFGVLYSNEYLYVSTETGIRIINVNDPNNLLEVGYYNTENVISFDMAISNKYLFLVGEINSGYSLWSELLVIDVSDPENSFEAGEFEVEGGSAYFAKKRNYIFLIELFVYGESFGIRTIDVSDEKKPMPVGFGIFNGYPYGQSIYQIHQIHRKSDL